jgi:glycosyltransferase involved in cell wall biosynthesis
MFALLLGAYFKKSGKSPYVMQKMAFVVPTKDRPDYLRALLNSVKRQTQKPTQLIVVDGSNPDIRFVVEEFLELNIDYVRVFPPSLAEQRNVGMLHLRDDITLAGYLDDDLELESNAIEEMLVFWDHSSSDLGGAAFNITNSPKPNTAKVKFRQWFGLDCVQPGKVLPSGFTSTLNWEQSDIKPDWLCGGATVWRREIVNQYSFDQWFQGTGYLEDLDFSFNVRGKYSLALVEHAKVVNRSPPMRADAHYLLGKWQIINRMYLVRKYRNRGLSVPSACFASIALLVMHLARALIRLDRACWDRARGNTVGILLELLGKKHQIGGFLK